MILERCIKGFGLLLALVIVGLLISATFQQAAIQREHHAQMEGLARQNLELDVLRARVDRNQTENALIRAYLENPYRTQPGALPVPRKP